MVIKKFQGKTENEAIENARKELGNGIVVMNVKEVKGKGLFSFLKPHTVEVTVALEDESEKYAPVAKKTVSIPATEQNANAPARVEESAREERGVEVLGEKLDSLQSLLVQQLQRREEQSEVPPVEEKKTDETSEKDESFVKFTKLIYQTMLENEVDEKYINQILEEIEQVHKPGVPLDYALSNIYQKMILKFGKPVGITPAQKGPKVAFFVGPTGVGKTTTIAKLASKFSLEEKKKVALLTADTYRIAAAEQLRTYANIMEVPFRVIYTTDEIEMALRDFRDFDYIFVDTTGHSQQNQEQRDTTCSFINCVNGLVEKEVFLVVSATTKYRDLLNIVDAYRDVAEFKLIFTKLDETSALGNLLNLKLYTGATLSYVTCGQNVPDDIEDFDPQKTVKRLMGGRK